MNILITGIHGFVGSNFVTALKDQHTLYGLDIVVPEKEEVVKTFSWKDLERSFADAQDDKRSGKDVYILRPCMIHGPGNKGNLRMLVRVCCGR